MTTESFPSVYVVDDDEAVRDSVCALLEVSGYRTIPFADATTFKDSFENHLACCVFLDVRLPDASGLDVNLSLRAIAPELPVVIMTGHGDISMAVKAMREGAADFIEKPFEEGRMIEALNRALSKNEAIDEGDVGGDLDERFKRLTPRETEVMQGLIAGNANKVIAHDLGLSPRTVEIHRSRVMKKTEADSLSELVKMALKAGIAT